MPEITDRRVRRTRKLLQEGLLKLLRHKTIGDVTVKELAEAADVARATVYVHYKDPKNVLAQLEQTMYSDVNAILAKYPPEELADDVTPLLEAFFAYVGENRDCFEVLAGPYGDDAFMGDIRALCCEQAMAVLRLQHSGMEEASIAYQATFLVGGYETLLARWIQGGCRETPRELVQLSRRMD